MRKLISLFLVTFLAIGMAGEAHAFRFSPFRVKFTPAGQGANQLFTVENNTDQPATVQIRVMTREVDVDGAEKNADAEKDFTVYPAQVILKPHEQRSVRIQWMGNAALKTEKAYRVIAEQLPVNLDKEQPTSSQVKFLTSYHAALFVTPKGLTHDVTLDFSGTEKDAKGNKLLEMVFNNRGTQHALLRDLKLTVKDGRDNEVTLMGEDELDGVTGEGILAGHKRRFLLPWPKDITGKLKSIDFTFDKKAF